MSAVTIEKNKTAGAVVDESMVPVQTGPVDERQATAEAIAAALDPDLVSRLAVRARSQGVRQPRPGHAGHRRRPSGSVGCREPLPAAARGKLEAGVRSP